MRARLKATTFMAKPRAFCWSLFAAPLILIGLRANLTSRPIFWLYYLGSASCTGTLLSQCLVTRKTLASATPPFPISDLMTRCISPILHAAAAMPFVCPFASLYLGPNYKSKYRVTQDLVHLRSR